MVKSNSRQEDERRSEEAKGRVESTHGGILVEAIAPGDLESVNDDTCKHENLVRDPTETEYNAFVCANSKCAEVLLFDKAN